jgi:hypothetical protein
MATADLMVGSSGVIHFFLRLSVNPGLDGALYTRMARSALSGAHGLYYAIGEANTRKIIEVQSVSGARILARKP